MRLSIRYKILAVTGLLLLAAVGCYTLLASFIFTEQKTALLFEINHSIAVNTASQVRSSLRQVGDQLKLYAVSRLLSGKSDLRLPASALRENHVLGMVFFKQTSGGWDPQRLPPDMPAVPLNSAALAPRLQQAVETGNAFWRDTRSDGVGSFFLATKVDLTIGAKPEIYVTVAQLDAKPFFEVLLSANLFESFLMTADGDVLVHVQDQKEVAPEPLPNHPLVEAQKNPARLSGVQSYDFGGTQWYGAFAPVGLGNLFFISQANQSEVTSALTVLLQRSLLFGLIVATLAFIASVLFSKSLTRNLRHLMQGAVAIGGGNLSSKINVRSGDEVEALAETFNQMVDALRASREAIERYNHELEEKVALRTQQLRETNAAIKSVQEKLLQATQLAAVGEVAGRTAHELLNPLTAIISRIERSRMNVQTAGGPSDNPNPTQLFEILNGWKQDYSQGGVKKLAASLEGPSTANPGKTLLDEDLANLQTLATYWQGQTEVVASDLDFVRDQAQRIHRIVDKMRELIRSSDKTDVACRGAAEEAVATMADFLAKHQVAIQLNWQADYDLAELNRDELIQILTNLLRNAYQAVTGAGRPGAIEVKATRENNSLYIDIADNGIGIPEANRRRLFDQGFTTKGPAEGTGLGLSICRRYARAFGGEVDLLFSKEGKGTCFRVTVPLKLQEAVA